MPFDAKNLHSYSTLFAGDSVQNGRPDYRKRKKFHEKSIYNHIAIRPYTVLISILKQRGGMGLHGALSACNPAVLCVKWGKWGKKYAANSDL